MGAFWVGEGYYLRCFSSQGIPQNLDLPLILGGEGEHHKVLDVLSCFITFC